MVRWKRPFMKLTKFRFRSKLEQHEQLPHGVAALFASTVLSTTLFLRKVDMWWLLLLLPLIPSVLVMAACVRSGQVYPDLYE